MGRTFSLAVLFSRMRLRRLSRAEDFAEETGALAAGTVGLAEAAGALGAATTGFAAGLAALAEEEECLSDFTGAADFFGAGLAAGECLADLTMGLAEGFGAGFLRAGLAAVFLGGGDFLERDLAGLAADFTGDFFVGDFFAAGLTGLPTVLFLGAGTGFLVLEAMVVMR